MRRDMDLIRLILLDLEGEEEVDLSGYSEEAMMQHKMLVYEAGLANGTVIQSLVDTYGIVDLERLTWEGHDFIDVARDDGTWQEATKLIGEKVGSTTFEVLKGMLAAFAADALGRAVL